MGYTTNIGADRIETGQGQKEDTLASSADKFDSTLAGRTTRSVAGGANVTLTDTEGRNARLEFTATLTTSITIFLRVPGGTPAGYSARRFTVYNGCTGG